MLELAIAVGSVVLALWVDGRVSGRPEDEGEYDLTVRVWKPSPWDIFPGGSAEEAGLRAAIEAFVVDFTESLPYSNVFRNDDTSLYWDLRPREVLSLYDHAVDAGWVRPGPRSDTLADILNQLTNQPPATSFFSFEIELLGSRESWAPQPQVFAPGLLVRVQEGPATPQIIEPRRVRSPMGGEEISTPRISTATSLVNALISMQIGAKDSRHYALSGLSVFTNTEAVEGWWPSPLLVPDAVENGEVWLLNPTHFTPIGHLDPAKAAAFIHAVGDAEGSIAEEGHGAAETELMLAGDIHDLLEEHGLPSSGASQVPLLPLSLDKPGVKPFGCPTRILATGTRLYHGGVAGEPLEDPSFFYLEKEKAEAYARSIAYRGNVVVKTFLSGRPRTMMDEAEVQRQKLRWDFKSIGPGIPGLVRGLCERGYDGVFDTSHDGQVIVCDTQDFFLVTP